MLTSAFRAFVKKSKDKILSWVVFTNKKKTTLFIIFID